MTEAIFLSAGIPDPKRGPEYAATADTVAIASAVSALVHVVLGRRLLVWGGHPAITPLIWAMSEQLGVEYGRWVRLYQSKFFEDQFPQDNQRFQNVTYVDAKPGDLPQSLAAMRSEMLKQHDFTSAVFIGGMGGIVDEFRLFTDLHPKATVVPVTSTGGATLDVENLLPSKDADLANDLDYVAVFHRHLRISVREQRYVDPDKQPAREEDRYWTPETRGS
jgi:hypothetical protein